MKRYILLSLALLVAIFAVEAQKAPKQVKLVAEVESAEKLQNLDISLATLVEGDVVDVNGKDCTVRVGKKGAVLTNVDKSDEGLYKVGYPADVAYCKGDASYIHLVPAQQYKEGAIDRLYMPMYGEKGADGALSLKALCGVLRFKVSGNATLNAIKVESNDGAYLSGYFDIDRTSATLGEGRGVTAGATAVVLDCSCEGKGVALDGVGKDFYVVLPAGNYAEGVTLKFTTRDHHTMQCKTKPFVVKRGEVTTLAPIVYAHPADQIFSEKFDNMVYGGDYMRGKAYSGFVPMLSDVEGDVIINGSERAVKAVTYADAGSKYLQRNWKQTPLEEGNVSATYLHNRLLADYKSLLRVQEFCGYVGVGVEDHNRGIFTTPAFSEIKELSDIEISFKFSTESRCTTDYNLFVQNAGVVKEYWINGVRHTLTPENYPFHNSHSEKIIIRRRAVSVGSAFADEEEKPWFEVRLVVSGATNETTMSIMAQKLGEKESNGFYIDDIEVKLLRSVPRSKILRVMDYNIQNGMWADQMNNYDNFVEYMKQSDVDIAIFCEASSIYYDHTNKRTKHEERYLPYKYQPYKKGQTDHLEPTGWIELAARFGHNFVAIGAHQDNYPVVVTSKYPIVRSVKLGGAPTSHGGIHAQVEVDGEIINIVGFHTWPHGWAYGVRGKEARAASKLEFGGHVTRYEETKMYLERTILNAEYADQKHWIITGDMNCYSPLDDRVYDLGYSNPRYGSQRCILEMAPQVKDLVKLYNSPDKRDAVVPSTMGGGRIDFMYGSDKFVQTMLRAKSPKRGFTHGKFDKTTRFYKERGSDHLPVVCDFEWR